MEGVFPPLFSSKRDTERGKKLVGERERELPLADATRREERRNNIAHFRDRRDGGFGEGREEGGAGHRSCLMPCFDAIAQRKELLLRVEQLVELVLEEGKGGFGCWVGGDGRPLKLPRWEEEEGCFVCDRAKGRRRDTRRRKTRSSPLS